MTGFDIGGALQREKNHVAKYTDFDYLCTLKDHFYDRVAKYIHGLKKGLTEIGDRSPESAGLIEEVLERVRRSMSELIDCRFRKIVGLVSTGDLSRIEKANLTPEEERAARRLLAAFDQTKASLVAQAGVGAQ